MTYTLIGSQTSPFVRRIRILLENIPFDFQELSVFEKNDAAKLNQVNPINQVPVLLDGDQKVWDSRHIFNYLNRKHHFFNLSVDEENLLTAIEGAISSGVTLLLMQRSGIDTNQPVMFIDRQKERIDSILNFMKPYIENVAMKEWNFVTITLYSFLDWATFRGIINLDHRPECRALLEKYAQKSIVQKTAIPKV